MSFQLIKSASTQALEGELRKLAAKAATAATELEQYEKLEAELEDEAQLAAADIAAKARRNRLRRLDVEIARVRERLAVESDAAKARLRSELLAKFRNEGRDFLVKARAAQDALAHLIEAREAVRSAGFVTDHQELPVPPAVNGVALPAPDLLDLFEGRLNPKPRPVPRPKARPAAVAPAPEPTKASPGAGRANNRAYRREIAGDGERLFAVHRGQVELPGRGAVGYGDVVALRPEEAEPLLRAGSGDYITPEAVAVLDASDALSGPGGAQAARQ